MKRFLTTILAGMMLLLCGIPGIGNAATVQAIDVAPFHIANGDTVEFFGDDHDFFLVCCDTVREFTCTYDGLWHCFTPKEDGTYYITRFEPLSATISFPELSCHVHCEYDNYYNYIVRVKQGMISVAEDGFYSTYDQNLVESYLACDFEKPEICNRYGCEGEFSFPDADSLLLSYWNGKMPPDLYYPSVERHGVVIPAIAFPYVSEDAVSCEDETLQFFSQDSAGFADGNFSHVASDTVPVALVFGTGEFSTIEPNSRTTYFSIAKTPHAVRYALDLTEDGRILPATLRIVPKETPGDVNADGVFGITDVLLVQKWLLGLPDVKLANWKAGDLCEDGRLNIFDLLRMKQELQENPVLLTMEGSEIWEVGLYAVPYSRVIRKQDAVVTPELLALVKKIAKKIAADPAYYEALPFRYAAVDVADYGIDHLYLPYQDAEGNPQKLLLGSFGAQIKCLDDPDVLKLHSLIFDFPYPFLWEGYGVPFAFDADGNLIAV